jgi:hypothetical protein
MSVMMTPASVSRLGGALIKPEEDNSEEVDDEGDKGLEILSERLC